MRMIILSIIVVLIMIGSSCASAVEMREIDQLMRIDPYYPDDYTDVINWSDPASADLSNYNSTVIPFMEETNITGSFTGSFMPPILAQVSESTTADLSWISCVARFKSDWVMSGSSYSWWRLPIQNMSGFSYINLTIWHLDNPPFIDIVDPNGEPNEGTRPIQIYWNHYVSDGQDLVWRNQTVSAWGFEWDFVWLRVVAPIHSDESYYVRFVYSETGMTDGHEIMFSQTDVGDDQITKSWFYKDEIVELEVDLDISVIHEYGMGYGVSGFEVPSENVSIKFYSSTSVPVEEGDNLTFMMPFFYDISTSNNVYVSIQGWDTGWSDGWWVAEGDEVVDFTIHSSEWTEEDPGTRFYINITFFNASNLLYIWDQFSDFYIYDDDDSGYQENRFFCGNHTWSPNFLYWFYFTPYHALQVADGEWVNVHVNPVYYLDGRYYEDFVFEKREHSDPWYVTLVHGLVLIPYVLYTILDKVILVDALPNLDLEGYLNWLSSATSRFSNNPAVKFLLSIGMFIWEVVKFVVKWAPYVLAALLKGMNLFIFVPIWVTCVLIINGVKRFGVIMASEGAVAAADYADDFVKNSVKMIRSVPVVKVARKVRGRAS